MGRLTTHVLDTAHGGPAGNVTVRLFTVGNVRKLAVTTVTDDNGRTPEPLLAGEMMVSGTYELEFDIGAYFRDRGVDLAEPAFLDTVVIRFAIDGDEDYHVPLLASPWSYSTYRGS